MASTPFNNPFAKLAGERDALPAGPAQPTRGPAQPTAGPAQPTPGPAQPTPGPAQPTRGPACAVLRRERKGHAGKEVTRVEKLGLTDGALASWCQALKRELGVGGQVDGADLVFQGDQCDRLAPMLEARGVRKVIRG